MLVWVSPAIAAPPARASWDAAELRPVPAGPALAWSPAWNGAPALFSGGPDGVRVLSADGTVRAQGGDLHPRALLVRQLDGAGDPEVVACGPEGLAMVRGDGRGLTPPRTLSDVPCDDVVAFDLTQYPALATATQGELVRWNPTRQGLVADHTGLRVVPGTLASSGGRLAAVGPDGDLVISGPDERVRGPISAVAGAPGGFTWAGAGLWSGGELPYEVSGVVVEGPFTWFLDADGRRLREVGGAWVPLPIRPVRAVAVPGECPDLWVVDAEGAGVHVVARCSAAEVATSPVAAAPEPEPPPPAVEPERTPPPLRSGDLELPPDGVPRSPDSVDLEPGEWRVVNVRAGETLDSRVSWGDGRAWRWRSRGGPPGFHVTADGAFEYEAEEEDVGRWRASIQSRAWPRSGWTGVEVRVWPSDTPFGEPRTESVPPTPPTPPGPESPVTAWVGIGAAGGVAKTNGSQWQNLGRSPTGGGASPFASILTQVRLAESVDVLAGMDSAPFFTYPSAPARRSHVVAMTAGVSAGTDALALGAYGTFGVSVRGVGVRFAATPWRDERDHPTGLEVRATWLAPQIGGEVAAAWLWAL